MTYTFNRLGAMLCAGVLLSAGVAHAGVITGFTVVTNGNGSASVNVVTNDPNNDNVSGFNNNNIQVVGKNFTANGPIDIVFTVANSGGVTEYFISEGVTNSTGIGWVGYNLQLGFGTGAQFTPVAAGTGLDFDTPDRDPTPMSSDFNVLVHLDNWINFGGGFVPHTGTDAISYSIDVPDGIGSFTLRQMPVPIPEPASLGLLGVAGLTLLRRRRA